jgi:hypothetical protein
MQVFSSRPLANQRRIQPMRTLLCILATTALLITSCKDDNPAQPAGNNPPTTPANPSPAGGATGISRSPVLSWTCSDPDGDSVKYELYFSSINPPNTLIAGNLIFPNYAITGLDSNRTYYWRVTPKDTKGAASPGPIWHFTTLSGSVPTQGLVAYHPFNGNANDESGNGNNGTVNGATLTSDRFGNANKSYSFNGTSNYVEVLDSPILRFNNSFSISLWVSLTSPYRLNYNMMLIGKALGSEYRDSYAIYTGYWTGGDTAVMAAYCNNSSCVGNDNNFSLHQNTWYNITWVFDKTLNVESFFTNNNLIKSQTISGTIGYDNHSLTIGNDFSYGVAAEFLAGKLDDIRIYNRALSGAEIQTLYHEGGW